MKVSRLVLWLAVLGLLGASLGYLVGRADMASDRELPGAGPRPSTVAAPRPPS